ncbi:MAG: hypothetical protein IPM95_07410 [Sphingobacteriales bacterium]|nr:hypothetical protein [Sphingobacteriales bacterium]
MTKIQVDKQWWKLDSITLKGGLLGKDTTVKNDFTKRPYDAGASFAYREKIGKLDVVAGGMFYKNKVHKWGDNEQEEG